MKFLWLLQLCCCIYLALAAASPSKASKVSSGAAKEGSNSPLLDESGRSNAKARVSAAGGPRVVSREKITKKEILGLLGGVAVVFIFLFIGLFIRRRMHKEDAKVAHDVVRSHQFPLLPPPLDPSFPI